MSTRITIWGRYRKSELVSDEVLEVNTFAEFVGVNVDCDKGTDRTVADDIPMIHAVVVEAREPMEKKVQEPAASSRPDGPIKHRERRYSCSTCYSQGAASFTCIER